MPPAFNLSQDQTLQFDLYQALKLITELSGSLQSIILSNNTSEKNFQCEPQSVEPATSTRRSVARLGLSPKPKLQHHASRRSLHLEHPHLSVVGLLKNRPQATHCTLPCAAGFTVTARRRIKFPVRAEAAKPRIIAQREILSSRPGTRLRHVNDPPTGGPPERAVPPRAHLGASDRRQRDPSSHTTRLL